MPYCSNRYQIFQQSPYEYRGQVHSSQPEPAVLLLLTLQLLPRYALGSPLQPRVSAAAHLPSLLAGLPAAPSNLPLHLTSLRSPWKDSVSRAYSKKPLQVWFGFTNLKSKRTGLMD